MCPLVLNGPVCDQRTHAGFPERKQLFALTASAFAIGSSEFIPVGLLPTLAKHFNVSVPKAGLLVSVYSLSITFASPILVLLLGRVNRKSALLLLMLLFAAGNLACAAAPTFALLLFARMLTALCHGAFFGIGSVVAAGLSGKHERAHAVALMFTGLTVANIFGVPAGTMLGVHFGFRAVFLMLTPLAAMTLLLLWRLLPAQGRPPQKNRQELRKAISVPIVLTLLISTLSSVSLFTMLTYLAPLLQSTTGFSAGRITAALVCFGLGITAGNLLGSRFRDEMQPALLLGGLLLLVLVLLAAPILLHNPLFALGIVALWGLVHFASGTPLQPRVIAQAKGANVAATLNQSAFNLGNALGAGLGGLLLMHGLPYRALPLAAALVAFVAFVVACVAIRRDTRARRTRPAL